MHYRCTFPYSLIDRTSEQNVRRTTATKINKRLTISCRFAIGAGSVGQTGYAVVLPRCVGTVDFASTLLDYCIIRIALWRANFTLLTFSFRFWENVMDVVARESDIKMKLTIRGCTYHPYCFYNSNNSSHFGTRHIYHREWDNSLVQLRTFYQRQLHLRDTFFPLPYMYLWWLKEKETEMKMDHAFFSIEFRAKIQRMVGFIELQCCVCPRRLCDHLLSLEEADFAQNWHWSATALHSAHFPGSSA